LCSVVIKERGRFERAISKQSAKTVRTLQFDARASPENQALSCDQCEPQ
jgi:hypothetical protein